MHADPKATTTWVFHAGALGDCILLWPLLRALRAAGSQVTLAARPSHAALTAAELRITGVDIDSPRFAPLWHEPDGTAWRGDRIPGVHRILTFIAGPDTPAGRTWLTNAAAMFPGASIDPIGPPGSPSRARLWADANVAALGRAEPRLNSTGPIILHVGAGSAAKRWPLNRWLQLTDLLDPMAPGAGIILLAGHVEHEQFTPTESAAFLRSGGRFIDDDLPTLTALLRSARLVLAADTGPTHLAAQLGVPTLALFGPTDPSVWSPVGPRVRLLAPPAPTAGMRWLTVERLAMTTRQFLIDIGA